MRTLESYLDAATATVLGVHRTTVAARIEQLLRVDLSRPDERQALHLASRAVISPTRDRRGAPVTGGD